LKLRLALASPNYRFVVGAVELLIGIPVFGGWRRSLVPSSVDAGNRKGL
jgi:hypothetical protein